MKKTVILLLLAASLFSCKRTYLCDCSELVGYTELHEYKVPKNQEQAHQNHCENNGCVWLGEK